MRLSDGGAGSSTATALREPLVRGIFPAGGVFPLKFPGTGSPFSPRLRLGGRPTEACTLDQPLPRLGLRTLQPCIERCVYRLTVHQRPAYFSHITARRRYSRLARVDRQWTLSTSSASRYAEVLEADVGRCCCGGHITARGSFFGNRPLRHRREAEMCFRQSQAWPRVCIC